MTNTMPSRPGVAESAVPDITPTPAPGRVVVDVRRPVVECGRYAAKATVGELVLVDADVFADGHDHVAASLWVRSPGGEWVESPMEPLGNDRWQGHFRPSTLGRWDFRVDGWIDRFGTWRAATQVKYAAGIDIDVELLQGAELLRSLDARVTRAERPILDDALGGLADGDPQTALLAHDLVELVRRHADRTPLSSSLAFPLQADAEQARFSAWYELFPRSTVTGAAHHGTLDETIDRLGYVADLGFDILYLPPVHPIGEAYRKGPNNTLESGADDVGSPWAIGARDGGHTAVHHQLGTVDDVARLAKAAADHGLALALDIAFQCSPDHPWVQSHPEWFRHRSDGTIQYAENPPKKYQDIYPLDFESRDWRGLWAALAGVVRFWVDQGVTIFRVDNPHTKAFEFWEWLITEVQRDHPETIFLSEAFTRPRVMEQLAKVGFSQSYTYFAWRQSRWELQDYFTELSTMTVDYLRPNAWPNTPDILTEQLQHGGRPMFVTRAVLASMLSPSWGVYGPAYELLEHVAVREGSEEYLDSEKYQLRHWNLDDERSVAPLLRLLNEIRRRHPALQHLRGLRFHRTDNEALLCFSKREPGGTDAVVVVVNLDPHAVQSGWLDVDLAAIGLPYESTFVVRDELGGGTYTWHGHRNWVLLDPHGLPAHVLAVRPVAP
jgi:starch synthase (maltosyl-transferring)